MEIGLKKKKKEVEVLKVVGGMMGGKEKLLLEIFKRSKGKYIKEIIREYNLNQATTHKWLKYFVAIGKVKTRKLGNLTIIEDVVE